MKKNPCLEVDFGKLRHNVTTILNLCSNKGIELVGITKGFNAIPEITRAMLESGVTILGDSRLENIKSLKTAGINVKMMLIRIPMLQEVDSVVKLTNCSLNSEISVMEALSLAAMKQNKIHEIILMVDLGDLREGILPEEIYDTVKKILPMKGIHLKGLGVNFDCVSGFQPSVGALNELVILSQKIEKDLGIVLEVISGGSTSSLGLAVQDTIPAQINQLRVGEGILLGHSDIFTNLENTFQDAFILSAEIIELKNKESIPTGKIGRNSFGEIPEFHAEGVRKRAILAIGKQEVYPDHLFPLDKKIKIIAASSDHLIIDVTTSAVNYKVGDEIQFLLSYPGILSTTTSKYVTVRII
jgi:ornithine racemase